MPRVVDDWRAVVAAKQRPRRRFLAAGEQWRSAGESVVAEESEWCVLVVHRINENLSIESQRLNYPSRETIGYILVFHV